MTSALFAFRKFIPPNAALLPLALIISCTPPAPQPLNPERQAHPVTSEGKTFYLELADTEKLSQLGLMHRKKLRPDHGMIFFFEPPRRVAFWMKNTLIPLTVAFLDESAVILEKRNMQPLDERTIISSSDRVRYAIEMEQGWFEKNNITIGSTVDLSALPAPADSQTLTPKKQTP